MAVTPQQVANALGQDAPPAALQWLDAQLAGAPLQTELRLRTVFAQVARRFGSAPWGAPAGHELEGWTLSDLARFRLLHAALELTTDDQHTELVASLLRSGELGEQVSVLRALAHLPHPNRFVELAVDACRTNVVPVFAALACHNPFPARYFPPGALRQLVLKGIFLGVPLRNMVDLPARVDRELARMVEDFAAERRAAGRAVPADVAYVLELAKGAP